MLDDITLRSNLASMLSNNARDFLNQGLDFLLSQHETERVAKFTLVNLQMSVELLVKWHLVENLGTSTIFKPKYHTYSNIEDLRNAIWSGSLKTITYEECKNQFLASNSLTPQSEELLGKFQTYRNRIVHSFMKLTYDECVVLSADLVFNVIREMFSDKTNAHFNRFIDVGNYNRLIEFPAYVEQAGKRVNAADAEEVLTCWECHHETLLHEHDEYRCVTCGARGDESATPFRACPFCGKNAFVYDGLNLDLGVRGECMACGRDSMVSKCMECGSAVVTEGEGRPVGAEWLCATCM